MRVLGYWLFYVVVGVFLAAMAIGGGGELGPEDERSPVKTRTKIISAASGGALAVTMLGLYLLTDATISPSVPPILLGVGGPASVALTIWSWVSLARDLRR